MSERLKLAKLADPFPAEDVEWRVSRSGMGSDGVWCVVLAYITARAIQNRLDDVCGPENWKTDTRILEVGAKPAFECGISILVRRKEFEGEHEWVRKCDVSEPTNIEPAKGGFSGAMKRAGAQWGIGRYLYHLDEEFAETAQAKRRGWKFAKLPNNEGSFYWKPPQLPGWALPKDTPSDAVSTDDLDDFKRDWRQKFAPENKDPAELREGFTRFVHAAVGEFPVADVSCWTTDAMEKCRTALAENSAVGEVDSDVPFEG